MRALALVGLLVASLTRMASADDDGAAMRDARAHTTNGQAHFDAGAYAEAIDEFRAAYALVPRPGLLYNLGQAYRLAGDCVIATARYRDYLARAPKTKLRTIVEDHLASLAPCVRARSAPTPGRTGKRVGLATGGVGLAITGVGAYLAMSGTDGEAEQRGKPATDAEGHQVLATAFLVGGAVTTLAGATLYYLGWRDAREAPTFSMMPLAGGAAASAGWRF